MKMQGYSPSVQKEFDRESQELRELASKTKKPGRTFLRLEDGHFKAGRTGRFKYWGLKVLRTVAPYMSQYCKQKLLDIQHLNDAQQKAAAARIAHMVQHAKTPPAPDTNHSNTPLSERKVITVQEALNYVKENPSVRHTADRSTWVIPPTLNPELNWRTEEVKYKAEPEQMRDNLMLEYRVVPDEAMVKDKLSKARTAAQNQQQELLESEQKISEKNISKRRYFEQAMIKFSELSSERLTTTSKKDTSSLEGSVELTPDRGNQILLQFETNTSLNEGEIGMAHCQGRRATMEDQFCHASFDVKISSGPIPIKLTGVFDGHGGSQAAKTASENLESYLKKRLEEGNPEKLTDTHIWNALKLAFVDLSHSIIPPENEQCSGTTANVMLQIGDKIWIANAGDSRAVLVPPKGTAEQISEDGKPMQKEYKESIEKRGGKVVGGFTPRVNGLASTAQGLGEHYSYGTMSSRPNITMYEKPSEGWGGYKVLQACDGLMDVTTSDRAGDIVQKATEKGMGNAETAALLTELAYEAGSGDNISVMVTSLA